MDAPDNSNILDMSLEDMIKSDKKLRGGDSNHRSTKRGDRGRNSNRNRSTPYSRQRPRRNGSDGDQWTHDLFDGNSQTAAGGDTSTYRKIQVANLHYEVTVQDLEDLFSTVGPLKRVNIVFDAAGRSTGIAKVQFETPAHAAEAIERYNNVTLDGKPMVIAYAPLGRGSSTSQPSVLSRLGGASRNSANRSGNNRSRGGPRRDGRRGNNSKSQADNKREPANRDDLDAELDTYMQVDSGATMQE
ncbi:RNA-binding domain-containing protein [Basidiobolus meristosporus CBS 931.73]|uniref:RNA-binding domain-containing protein n=1 Tax=Basidiobolus meristosporus CBS 931.73 TaxID=1314790 RepID=A0A1Y1XL90_9FUNG|nr:RNA-binding domain-containing protein [Basidiobolus meristosporus CBS 931.73]|eukprot:ORX86482.1 RNA-binding domain-containing protein [Basidiobolus meristosporus CBS 931.73]